METNNGSLDASLENSLRKEEGSILIRVACQEDVPHATKVINWAYRYKEGVKEAWTTEGTLIVGDRMKEPMLSRLIATQSHATHVILVIIDEPKGIVGCIKLEVKEQDCCELGLFAIDPSFQGFGYGKKLFAYALHAAKNILEFAKASMCVITIRHEILAWYAKFGFKDTGKRVPFPQASEDVGVPRPEVGPIEFAVLEAPL